MENTAKGLCDDELSASQSGYINLRAIRAGCKADL